MLFLSLVLQMSFCIIPVRTMPGQMALTRTVGATEAFPGSHCVGTDGNPVDNEVTEVRLVAVPREDLGQISDSGDAAGPVEELSAAS